MHLVYLELLSMTVSTFCTDSTNSQLHRSTALMALPVYSLPESFVGKKKLGLPRATWQLQPTMQPGQVESIHRKRNEFLTAQETRSLKSGYEDYTCFLAVQGFHIVLFLSRVETELPYKTLGPLHLNLVTSFKYHFTP